MTVTELSKLPEIHTLHLADGTRNISGIYCCDLLSWAMSRAPENCAWITVMSNLNTLAVASLCDVSAVILADGAAADPSLIQKAQEQEINLFRTDLPIYPSARLIDPA